MIIISLSFIFNGCYTKNKNDLTEDQLVMSSEQKHKILTHIYENKQQLHLCNGEIDKSVSQNSSSIYRLNEKEYLVEIMCFLAAYQGNYQYFLYKNIDSEFTIKPLYFQLFSKNNRNKINLKNIRHLGGFPNYDQETQILTIYTKGRGLADCGSFSQYKWEQDRFKLLEYRLKSECDGNYIEPENYPQIYP
jgi:hypothetical protein